MNEDKTTPEVVPETDSANTAAPTQDGATAAIPTEASGVAPEAKEETPSTDAPAA